MEARHVRWAMQHDWYRAHSYNTAKGTWSVSVRNDVPALDDKRLNLLFTDYTELRHWAGY